MCIICYKPANKEIERETVREMVESNPHGTGYAYFCTLDKKIYLSKGYLDKEQAIKAVMSIPKEYPAIIHARIKTHGTHAVGQTHPFPLVADKDLLEKEDLIIRNGYVVAHNGIFHNISMGAEYSDTEAFIYKVLAPLEDALRGDIRLTDDSLKDCIDMLVGTSKIAIMDGKNGKVQLYGDGWIWDGGLAYSNSSYKPTPITNYYNYLPARTENKRVCEIKEDFMAMVYDYTKSKFEEDKVVIHPTEYSKERKYYCDSEGNIYVQWNEYGTINYLDSEYLRKKGVAKYYNEREAVTVKVNYSTSYYKKERPNEE